MPVPKERYTHHNPEPEEKRFWSALRCSLVHLNTVEASGENIGVVFLTTGRREADVLCTFCARAWSPCTLSCFEVDKNQTVSCRQEANLGLLTSGMTLG